MHTIIEYMWTLFMPAPYIVFLIGMIEGGLWRHGKLSVHEAGRPSTLFVVTFQDVLIPHVGAREGSFFPARQINPAESTAQLCAGGSA